MTRTTLQPTSSSRRWWLLIAAAGLGLLVAGLLSWQIWLLQRQHQVLQGLSREHQFWILCQPTTPAEERTRAFAALVAGGHTEWRSAMTQGLNLRGSRMIRAQLKLADLGACDLREAMLIEADLTGASLRTADLSGADLTEATLDGAECLKAKLDGADFHKARLRSISLEQVSAVKTRFVLADISDGLLLMADLSDADLTGADLTGATLESANLRGATLALTNLTHANLKNADLTDSNWWRARGLSHEQLVTFAADYPPTDAADPARIQDYLLWSEKFGSATGSDEGPPSGSAAADQ